MKPKPPDPADPKKPLTVDELHKQANSLIDILNHQTPIACVLVATSFIEQCLSTLLHSFTIEGDTSDQLCDYKKGVLKEMRSRATMCYCLGLFDTGLYNNLIAIGDIRNRFAHAHMELTFADAIVAKHCGKLVMDTPISFASNVPGRTPADTFADVGSTAQGRFVLIVFIVATKLVWLARDIKRCQKPPDTWVISAPIP
jgi:DNA-binding MltR family transcriptional regulator